MFGMLGDLAKAAVGVVVETPIALVKDAVTLGGAVTDEPSATVKALEKVGKNLSNATKPD